MKAWNPAGIGDGFESRANVDAVAHVIAVDLLDDVKCTPTRNSMQRSGGTPTLRSMRPLYVVSVDIGEVGFNHGNCPCPSTRSLLQSRTT